MIKRITDKAVSEVVGGAVKPPAGLAQVAATVQTRSSRVAPPKQLMLAKIRP